MADDSQTSDRSPGAPGRAPDDAPRASAGREGAAPVPEGERPAGPRPAGERAAAPGRAPVDRASGPGAPPPLVPGDWRPIAVVAALLIAWLLYAARQLLDPLVVTLLLLFVLHPYRRAAWARRVMIAVTAIGVLWLADRLGGALAPFVIAIVVAYYLDPAVDRLEERGLGRSLAILVLVVPVFGVLTAALLLIVPPLMREVAEFVRQLPTLVNTVVGFVEPWIERVDAQLDLLEIDIREVVAAHLPGMIDPLNALVGKITAGALFGAASVGRGVGAGIRLIGFLVITPLATFYALRDIDRFKDAARELIAERGHALEVLGEVDALLGHWLRGQLIVCSVLGGATWIGLYLLGVPYALLLGILTGVLNIVPFVGFWLSFAAVVLVALTMPSPFASVIKVVLFYLVAQIVESNVLSPRIVGREVGLNPVLMILSIVVFSALWGFVGVLVAVPAAAILALLYRRWRAGAVGERSTAAG